jgi:hypothetical protein
MHRRRTAIAAIRENSAIALADEDFVCCGPIRAAAQ